MARWSGTTKWSRRARKKNIDRHPQSDIYKSLVGNFGKTLAFFRRQKPQKRKELANSLFAMYMIENDFNYDIHQENELKGQIEKLLNLKNHLFRVNEVGNWYHDWSRGSPYSMQDYKKYLEFQKEKIK